MQILFTELYIFFTLVKKNKTKKKKKKTTNKKQMLQKLLLEEKNKNNNKKFPKIIDEIISWCEKTTLHTLKFSDKILGKKKKKKKKKKPSRDCGVYQQ